MLPMYWVSEKYLYSIMCKMAESTEWGRRSYRKIFSWAAPGGERGQREGQERREKNRECKKGEEGEEEEYEEEEK